MTSIDLAVEQLIGLTEEVGTGIYLKRLDNGRDVFSCKCPGCGTIHGGYRTYGEAVANKKCTICHRNEIEKLKKEVEKVDEPKKQKSIFQSRLNKPAVIGEADDDDFHVKDVAMPAPERVAYEIDDGHERYPVTNYGKIGRQEWDHWQMSGGWIMRGLTTHYWSNHPIPWNRMREQLDRGVTLEGYLWDVDHGTTRRWGRRVKVYKLPVSESEEDEDVKSILGGDPSAPPSGVVNKLVCMNAHYGQEFYHRTEKNADRQTPIRVRASGRCKTWATRPNEFRLPVKYGLYQSLVITHGNAQEWTTDPSRVEPPRLRPHRSRRGDADQGGADQVQPPGAPVE